MLTCTEHVICGLMAWYTDQNRTLTFVYEDGTTLSFLLNEGTRIITKTSLGAIETQEYMADMFYFLKGTRIKQDHIWLIHLKSSYYPSHIFTAYFTSFKQQFYCSCTLIEFALVLHYTHLY